MRNLAFPCYKTFCPFITTQRVREQFLAGPFLYHLLNSNFILYLKVHLSFKNKKYTVFRIRWNTFKAIWVIKFNTKNETNRLRDVRTELKSKNSTRWQHSCHLVEFLVFNWAFGRYRRWLRSRRISKGRPRRIIML